MSKIAAILGKVTSKPLPMPADSEPEMDSDAPSKEEIDAMKLFEMAGSTEEKAEALKTFIKACGAY